MIEERHVSHRHRYREIASAAVRHGLGYLTIAAGLGQLIPFHRGLLGHRKRDQPYSEAEHVRLAAEDLGATFIKIAQIVSTRADIIPPEYQRELAKLQDQAAPAPVEGIKQIIVDELGAPLSSLFASFDPKPLASASIGQAHAATLPDGTEVVVKVRRPGVVEQIYEDLDILGNLAAAANRRSEWAQYVDFVALVREFAATLRAELDYVREAENIERFASNFRDDPDVRVPRVFHELSTARVLTLERLYGCKPDDLASLDEAAINRKALAERLVRSNLKMVFEDGFFHADPHPGNFFVQPDGTVGLIDFGMAGTLSETLRLQLGAVIIAIQSRNSDRLLDSVVEICIPRAPVDRSELRSDLDRIVATYYGQPLAKLSLSAILQDIMAAVRRHHLRMPADLGLLFKTWVMLEGLVSRVDPSTSPARYFASYMRRLLVQQYSPTLWFGRLRNMSLDATMLASELPSRLHRLLVALENGTLQINTRAVDLASALERIERIASRSNLTLVLGALIVGLAVVTSMYGTALVGRWAIVPAFAFSVAITTLVGAYVGWTIVRPRSRP
jgi:ubiquinone biosynthesis protein